MKQTKWVAAWVLLAAGLLMVACGSSSETNRSQDDAVGTVSDLSSGDSADGLSPFPDANENADGVAGLDGEEGDASSEDPDAVPGGDSWGDYDVDPSDVTYIHLLGAAITVDGPGATVNGTVVVVTAAGTYVVDGTLNDGQLVVNAPDTATVNVMLDGANMHCSFSSPVSILSADDVVVILKEGTQNQLSDTANYEFATGEDEPNATLFSKSDLFVVGAGTLHIDSNYNDGIGSKDSLTLEAGELQIESVDDGIRGKDDVTIHGGVIRVTAGGDGIKSDNAEDSTRGWVLVDGGEVTLDAAGDGIDAETDVVIHDGTLIITSGGGSGASVSSTDSAKGIKGTASVLIDGGTVTLNCADDAVHSNVDVTINGGTFEVSTGDDAFHGDETLTFGGGNVTVSKSYEGLESKLLTLNDGVFHITSSDDGINAAGGNDGSGGWTPGAPPPGGNYYFYMNGGYVYVNGNGDGIDINGSIVMTGGTLLVNGPTANDNSAIDYDQTFTISGGFVVGAGSSGMAMAPSSAGSTQNSILVNLTSVQQAGTLFHLEEADGTELLTFKPVKTFQSVSFSSPDITKGTSCRIYTGGSSTGTLTDSLYQGGVYSPGTQVSTFTVSNTVTTVGNSGPPGW